MERLSARVLAACVLATIAGLATAQDGAPTTVTVAVAGTVVGPAGAPVADAEVVRNDRSRIRIRIAPTAVQAAVVAIQAAGGHIAEIVEVRATLESVLLSEMERATPIDQRRMGIL